MSYSEMLRLYKNNEFREIDRFPNSERFYLLRSISKASTLREFCKQYNLNESLDEILDSEEVTEEKILSFIDTKFQQVESIDLIAAELNKMQYFDWGGSFGNSLEKNIVTIIKRLLRFEDIREAIEGRISESVTGYTLNSWYNHWSSIMIEELFRIHPRVVPTIDKIKSIDFFIDGVPFDLKVTYFPQELMAQRLRDKLKNAFGSVNELTCLKREAKRLDISIPDGLNDSALKICLTNLLSESVDKQAREFLKQLADMKEGIIRYYQTHSKELILWLYENQGERRFDAANRYYLVLVDSENYYDSWKLKRNKSLLKDEIDTALNLFSKEDLNLIQFTWSENGMTYECFSELLFIVK